MGSTIAPDLDVIYNTLFRGFFNHSILWPHSLWPHLSLGLAWWTLRHARSGTGRASLPQDKDLRHARSGTGRASLLKNKDLRRARSASVTRRGQK
jgi:hypothetical protein